MYLHDTPNKLLRGISEMHPHKYGQPVSKENLRELQLNELAILIEIDRVCRKNHIEYSLFGGTLLGAVRHKGFIPWDDDIDVSFSRKEYLRFRNACQKDLNHSLFFLQDHISDSSYPWGYEKMRLIGSNLTRPGQEHIHCISGVFVDIFVMDNVPDFWFYRRIHFLLCFIIRKLLYAQLGMEKEKKPLFRLFYKWCYEHIPRKKVFHLRDTIASVCNSHPSQLMRHMTYPHPKRSKYGCPAINSFQNIVFEGYVFRCYKDYDAFLTAHYGNYKKLPPQNKQVPELTIGSLQLISPELLFSEEELKALGWHLT